MKASRFQPKATGSTGIDRNRWAIVLAGGDGVRLRELSRFINGDDRPKQFCTLLRSGNLVETTRQRVKASVRAEHILYSLTESHRRFFPGFLKDSPSQQVVQPCNRGTAPAILSSLLEVARRDPRALVAVLPCDHYFSDQRPFFESLERAFDLATSNSESVILLGVPQLRVESGYGWIETGERMGGTGDAYRIDAFNEKPAQEMAEQLMRRGALVNTFAMVGNVHAFLELVAEMTPGLLRRFLLAQEAHGDSGKPKDLEFIYSAIGAVDFSSSILAPSSERLIAIRLDGVDWTDLGDPRRVIELILRMKIQERPDWFAEWQDRKSELSLVSTEKHIK